MNTTDLVHFVSHGERPRLPAARPAPTPTYHELVGSARIGIVRARQSLLHAQHGDGTWWGHTASDASLASQWILVLAYFEQERSEQVEQAARTICDMQLPGGGWARFVGGPVDVSTSVQAYFALKLAGFDPADERLSRPRAIIRRHGGADATDITTRYYLALLGQIDYDCCPVFSPERQLLDSTQRGELAPLSVLWSHRPVREIGLSRGVRELFVAKPVDWHSASHSGWRRVAAHFAVQFERRGWTPLRRRALSSLEANLLHDVAANRISRLSFSELAIRLIALDSLGYVAGSVPYDACYDRLRVLVSVDDGCNEAQPDLRISPLTDTALVLRSFCASGVPLRQLVGQAVTSWLARPQRIDSTCDTTELVRSLETLRVASAELVDAADSLPPDIQISINGSTSGSCVRPVALQRRARRMAEQLILQLVDRQNADGGWSPIADGRAASAADVTGCVLEALADCGGARVRHSVDQAIDFLRSAQRADGSWNSATGVRFVHGTSSAVCGLLAAGISPEDDIVAAGINWLVVHQQPGGGWGELPSLPVDVGDDYATGRATATQTAWALAALIAAGMASEAVVRRGVQFLVDAQDDDGSWHESQLTLRDAGTGRWYRNDLHTAAWALVALSRWAVADANEVAAERPMLRLVGAES